MAPDIDVSMLIQEIQNRPVIYDTSKAEYRDRNLRRKMWNEVCCNIYSAPVWTSMTSKEKTKCGKDIQTKWNSLRSCFRRELNAQKNIPSGSERKKKRKYVYFDSLLFLLPFTVIENNQSSIETEQSSESLDVTTVQSSDTESTGSKRPKTQTKRKSNCYDDQYLEILREGNQLMRNINTKSESRTILGDTDEDESFLRSLLPYVKQFSSDQKLQLRIELIQTILNFKNSSSSTATQQVSENIDPPNNSNMSYADDTAERPSTESSNCSNIVQNLEYVPRPISVQYSSGSSYTPTPVHRDYDSIISPENESLFSLGDDDGGEV